MMMLELIVPDAGGLRKGESVVSISGKFSRILLYKEAYAEMKRCCGEDFEYVQFFSDRQEPDRFWIKPATKEALGRARIVLNQANATRTISVAHLLKVLNWDLEQSVRCPMRWDEENSAAVVLTGQTEV
ncbi:MAG: hypothetical protein V1876_01670 [Candidatus Peregrinibacteria bacterium]